MTYPAKTTTNFYVWQPTISQVHTDLGGQNEISETFVVEKKGSTTSTHTEVQFDRADFKLMVDDVVLPDIGMLYGTWNPDATNTKSWHQYARCRGYTITPLPDGRVQVVTQWSTQYTANPASVVAGTPFMILPCSIEMSTQTRVTELYRQNYTTQPLANVDKSASDIGGTATAKKAGIPIEVNQNRIRVRIVKDATVEDMDVALFYFANAMIGKKNDATFLGYGAEELVCQGVTAIKLEGEFYEMTWDLLYDEFYEHDQVPEFDNQGAPVLDATGTNFADVRWNRKDRDDFDFEEIFFDTLAPTVKNTDMLAHIEKGYWV